jgi:hypothetical protein
MGMVEADGPGSVIEFAASRGQAFVLAGDLSQESIAETPHRKPPST